MPLAATYSHLPAEQERLQSLLNMVPRGVSNALDVGAADCYFSALLANCVPSVTAVDLEQPVSPHPRISTARGDVTSLAYPDNAFDLVVCSEVLEHVESRLLQQACSELSRVARRFVLVAVPYEQDIRLGRTTCAACGKRNFPYGHVNRFDENSLRALFPAFTLSQTAFVGHGERRTNFLSAWLMDIAGNPYGTYKQQQPCMYCGSPLVPPERLSHGQRVAARAALMLNRGQAMLRTPRAHWIDALFQKTNQQPS